MQMNTENTFKRQNMKKNESRYNMPQGLTANQEKDQKNGSMAVSL